MKTEIHRLRVATYNIHKCRGMDRRVRPGRIVEVLREMHADVIALQEVLSREGNSPEEDQARFIAQELGLYYCMGATRKFKGAAYGNAVLSRWPIEAVYRYDLSVRQREPRACLRADVRPGGGRLLHIFNVHLGTAFIERRHQARKLTDREILNNDTLRGSRIMLGDFNEWTRGLTTQLLAAHLESADIRIHLRRSRTYPGLWPLLHLDHIYFDKDLELVGLTLVRSRRALMASDHLPLIAEFGWRSADNGWRPLPTDN